MELVTLDLDGTLIETTVFAAAGEALGLGEEIAFFDDLYFRGILSIDATFRAEYELFLDRLVAEVQQGLREGPWLDAIGSTVDQLRAWGLQVWVVTDQPDWAVEVLEPWGIEDGVFSTTRRWGDRIGPVEDRVVEKWPPLETKLEGHGVSRDAVCHVGNGTNDVPVFENVGRSIALNPSDPSVSSAADRALEASSLAPILGPIDAWMEAK